MFINVNYIFALQRYRFRVFQARNKLVLVSSFSAKWLKKDARGMIFVRKVVANAHKKGMNDSLFTP
jgi:hypothetical protein